MSIPVGGHFCAVVIYDIPRVDGGDRGPADRLTGLVRNRASHLHAMHHQEFGRLIGQFPALRQRAGFRDVVRMIEPDGQVGHVRHLDRGKFPASVDVGAEIGRAPSLPRAVYAADRLDPSQSHANAVERLTRFVADGASDGCFARRGRAQRDAAAGRTGLNNARGWTHHSPCDDRRRDSHDQAHDRRQGGRLRFDHGHHARNALHAGADHR